MVIITFQISAIVLTSMFLVTVSYLIVGYAGLAMFGSDVQPDIILSFPNNSITMTIGRIAIFISVSMTYPIVAFIGMSLLTTLSNFKSPFSLPDKK